MKITLFKFIAILSVLLLVLQSCRKEEIQSIQAPEEDTLEANSNIAQLIQNMTMNDGSRDNILDYANCYSLKWPVVVQANTIEVQVHALSDLQTVEAIFDVEDEDVNVLNINFPITIIQADYSEITVQNSSELSGYANTCNGENESDMDIECIDFEYPISASLFNTSNELLSTENFTTDKELFLFVNGLTEADIVRIDFPVSVRLSDNTITSINDFIDLETIITSQQNNCDEDDDFDYSDDDCDTCTLEQLNEMLVDNCSDWFVKDLTRNNNDLEDTYIGYRFNFFSDNTLQVDWLSTTVYGTWMASGTGNAITVDIDIPSLPDCNNSWTLHELQQYNGEFKIDLTLGDERLRYISTCN